MSKITSPKRGVVSSGSWEEGWLQHKWAKEYGRQKKLILPWKSPCFTHKWSVPAGRTLPFIAWAGSSPSPWLKQEKARTLPCSPNRGKGICSTVPRRLWEICLSSSSWEPETNFSSLRCSTSRVRSCLPDVWPHLAGGCALPWGTAPR